MNALARAYLLDDFLPAIQKLIGHIASAQIRSEAPDVIAIAYPGAFEEKYLRPEILLEVGPLAAWLPNAEYSVTPYAAEEFPHLFEQAHATTTT